jgi:hypothetical protein
MAETNIRQKKYALLIIAGMAVIMIGFYLFACLRITEKGFPLDDAWIHQTFARNLAIRGEWAFLPGIPSAGSTAPLWSILLSPGFIMGAPYIWTILLGLISLIFLGVVGQALFRKLITLETTWFPFAGFFLVGEWHLVWSAVSGMETMIIALLIVIVFYMLSFHKPSFYLVGFLCGLACWFRPDGITLLGPALMIAILGDSNWRSRGKHIVSTFIPFAVIFIPYILFNQAIAGSWWPNTFFAKQAEYTIYLQQPFLERYFGLVSQPLIGGGILLLPGFIYGIWVAARGRKNVSISVYLWWFGYNFLYAIRLPLTYQHGRYIMPAMPVFFILGLIGTYHIFQNIPGKRMMGRILRLTWAFSIVATWVGFSFIGGKVYSEDVAIINSEMVTTARWIKQNTPADSLIAAHDIGAIGYFGERKLIDLAGLISPEVIPFIRDEEKLEDYINVRGVDYLIIFPGWYPNLQRWGEPVFKTNGIFAPTAGGENMVVYQKKLP